MPTCINCGVEFVKTGRNQKRCIVCAQAAKLVRSRVYYDKHYRTGLGKGGNQRGSNNHQWKGGVSPQNYRDVKLNGDPRRACERCKADLSKFVGVKRYSGKWSIHHKDGNYSNRSLGNLELLCKRCHQIEHKCWENFGVKV